MPVDIRQVHASERYCLGETERANQTLGEQYDVDALVSREMQKFWRIGAVSRESVRRRDMAREAKATLAARQAEAKAMLGFRDQVGHKKSECRNATRVNGVDEENLGEEDVVECGGVWMVGDVDVRVNHSDAYDDFPDLEYAQGFQLPTKTCRSRGPRLSSGDRQRRLKNKFGQLDNTIDFEVFEVSVEYNLRLWLSNSHHKAQCNEFQ